MSPVFDLCQLLARHVMKLSGFTQLQAVSQRVRPWQVPARVNFNCSNNFTRPTLSLPVRYDTWTREFGMDGANVAAVGGNDAESNQSQPALQGPSASKGAQKPPKSGDDSCRIC